MRKCDVCNKESNDIKVCGSACGPVSFAYCPDCLACGAEPYGAMVSYLSCADVDEDNWSTELDNNYIQSVIEPTLRVANKSHQDLTNDLRKLNEELYFFYNNGYHIEEDEIPTLHEEVCITSEDTEEMNDDVSFF